MNTREDFIELAKNTSDEDLVQQLIASSMSAARDADTGGHQRGSANDEVAILKEEVLNRLERMQKLPTDTQFLVQGSEILRTMHN